MPYEYIPYGGSPTGWQRRQRDSTDPWEDVPDVDAQEAESDYVAEKLDGAMKAEAGRLNTVTIRSHQNIGVGSRLGLTADELAELLNSPTRNSGTRLRIPDEEFDELAGILGLSPQEFRDRFAGRFWEA